MTILIWISFVTFIVALIALDLGVLHRRAQEVTVRSALRWWLGWVSLALIFNVYIYYLYDHNWLGWGVSAILDLSGREAATQFFTGYLIELSLSVDNVFVIAAIFSYMRIPAALQYRLLFWGILGAIVMRGLMIAAGAVLIARFSWVTYVFGAVLILSAARLLVLREGGFEPERSVIARVARRFYPISPQLDGGRFFTEIDGRRAATPLFLTLLMVEWADVLFAVDSVPAIFAVTTDPFLVFTSNVFAILGLRTLFFVVAGMMNKFRFLKASLVFVLAYIGVKMLLTHHHPIPTAVSLAVILGIMLVGILASVLARNVDQPPAHR